MPTNQNLTVQFAVRLTPAEGAQLDEIAHQGGYSRRGALVRSLIREILRDEAASGHLPQHVVNEGESVSTTGARN